MSTDTSKEAREKTQAAAGSPGTEAEFSQQPALVSHRAHPRDIQDHLPYMNAVDAALNRQPIIGTRFLSASTVAVFFLFLLWAAWGTVDEVTKGLGQVIASQRTQIIKNLEGGILEDMLVREGQVVQKDMPLARISNQGAQSAYRDIQDKIFRNRAAVIRLEAELDDHPLVFDPQLLREAPDVVADQKRMYNAHIRQHAAELDVLKLQYTQKLGEIEEHKNHKLSVERNLGLIRQQLAIAEKLIAKQLYSRVEYLNTQQKYASLQGELSALESTIPNAEAAAQEAQQKYELRKAELDSQDAAELEKMRTELSSLEASLSAGSDRVERTELRSPVLGTVKQILLTTVGGVVNPGEPIMEIVPLDDSLLVEARIRPADIAFIHKGQKAVVKISAYDYSIYGGLEGTVEELSADTIEDRRGEFYYLAKVRTKANAIQYRGKTLPIMPGMIATVDILTGKKTVLDFLLKPILKAQENALRER